MDLRTLVGRADIMRSNGLIDAPQRGTRVEGLSQRRKLLALSAAQLAELHGPQDRPEVVRPSMVEVRARLANADAVDFVPVVIGGTESKRKAAEVRAQKRGAELYPGQRAKAQAAAQPSGGRPEARWYTWPGRQPRYQ